MTCPPGTKHDSGKERFDLIPPLAAQVVACVLTIGANKYDDENWRTLANLQKRYLGAAYRHLNAFQRGEVLDPESGLPHLGHAITSLMFVLEDCLAPAHKSPPPHDCAEPGRFCRTCECYIPCKPDPTEF